METLECIQNKFQHRGAFTYTIKAGINDNILLDRRDEVLTTPYMYTSQCQEGANAKGYSTT